jgi:lysophospholipase L1-like esterase
LFNRVDLEGHKRLLELPTRSTISGFLRGAVLSSALLAPVSIRAAPEHSVLLIGDSVMAALSQRHTDAATRAGQADWKVGIDSRPCRKATTPGCKKGTPESTLAVLRARRAHLGNTVLVIMVGHNDDRGPKFRSKVEAILEEARGSPQVFWLTMREISKSYATANRIIEEEASRRPNVQVIPWAEASRSRRSWVARDGVHLTALGAKEMASLIFQTLERWIAGPLGKWCPTAGAERRTLTAKP